jgi:hypothetical protein
MKSFLFAVNLLGLFLLSTWAARAQGVTTLGTQRGVLFVTYSPNSRIDAPVSYPDGARVGPEFIGQLFAGPAGTPVSALAPLLPVEHFGFFPDQPQFNGYIFGGIVMIPNVEGNQFATIVLRAYNSDSWETSSYRGESEPITIRLGTPSGTASELIGLEGFNVQPVPEPSTLMIALIGGLLLLKRARAKLSRGEER